MIATGNELKRLLGSKLIIDPILDEKSQIMEVSIDLRLDNRFLILRKSKITHVESHQQEEIAAYSELLEVDPLRGYFALHPNDLVIGQTFEYVMIPKEYYAILDGRSSLARLGIVVHATAMSVDPGFQGHISFEIVNMGPTPVKIFPLTRVARLILFKTSSEVRARATKYSFDIYPSSSRLWKDKDLVKWVEGRTPIDLDKACE